MLAKISQDSSWGKEMACIHFHGEETNIDKHRQGQGAVRSNMETVQTEEKGMDLEMAWFPRNVVGEER